MAILPVQLFGFRFADAFYLQGNSWGYPCLIHARVRLCLVENLHVGEKAKREGSRLAGSGSMRVRGGARVRTWTATRDWRPTRPLTRWEHETGPWNLAGNR